MNLKGIIRILAVLYGVLLFSVCTNAAEIVVESNSAAAGSTAEISVSIKPTGENTESMNGYAVQLTYDNTVLTPVVQGTDLLGDDLYAKSSLTDGVFAASLADGYDNVLTVSWVNADAIEFSEETELFTVRFKIADEVGADSTNIELSVVQYAYSSSELAENSDISVTAGTITFSVDTSGTLGDVDGDGVVDGIDASIVSRYVVGLQKFDETYKDMADVDGDSEVDGIDASIISRYVVGLQSF
ncbi:MAG: dockerin type I domain-containing protein [Clostridiales bacterium]|nr:dockerin type I domain-containing protein [Clostridiales bacterium]